MLFIGLGFCFALPFREDVLWELPFGMLSAQVLFILCLFLFSTYGLATWNLPCGSLQPPPAGW